VFCYTLNRHNGFEERKVIFLDIDGVLQRGIAQDRFNHDFEELKCKLAKEFNDDGSNRENGVLSVVGYVD
jgi:hypothetical protein